MNVPALPLNTSDNLKTNFRSTDSESPVGANNGKRDEDAISFEEWLSASSHDAEEVPEETAVMTTSAVESEELIGTGPSEAINAGSGTASLGQIANLNSSNVDSSIQLSGETEDLPNDGEGVFVDPIAGVNLVPVDAVAGQISDTSEGVGAETFQPVGNNTAVASALEESQIQSDSELSSQVAEVESEVITDANLQGDAEGDNFSSESTPSEDLGELFEGNTEDLSTESLQNDSNDIISSRIESSEGPARTDLPSQNPGIAANLAAANVTSAEANALPTDPNQLLQNSYQVRAQAVDAMRTQFASFTDEPSQSISVELNPPELGRLQINVQQTSDQLVTHIVATDLGATDLLLHEKDFLLEALNELGFGDASVDISYGGSSDQSDDPNGSAAERKYSKASESVTDNAEPVSSQITGVNFVA